MLSNPSDWQMTSFYSFLVSMSVFFLCLFFVHGKYFLFNTPVVLLISGQGDSGLENDEDEGR